MGHIHETRLNTRRNLFVAAQLRWENSEVPVRIRNISVVGALIESDGLPDVETPVRLIRGQHSAHGHLVWVRGAKAGMVFPVPIDPDGWLPSRMRVRQVEKPLDVNADGDMVPDSRSSAHAQRDLIVAEHLARVRAMVEDLRLDVAKHEGHPLTASSINKLDVIYRLLDWQVAELQP